MGQDHQGLQGNFILVSTPIIRDVFATVLIVSSLDETGEEGNAAGGL